MLAWRFAQAFRRFGSRITVIDYAPQLLGREDPDVAKAVRVIFAEGGIDVIVGAEALGRGALGRPSAYPTPDKGGRAES
jgi:pyruvate/2-oxoglutarate dehydrogenase complex dihydrolipoamide dehydrogenase (E3) component